MSGNFLLLPEFMLTPHPVTQTHGVMALSVVFTIQVWGYELEAPEPVFVFVLGVPETSV